MIAWPPKYSLKKHSRAKYVKFKICQRNGLQITVPLKFKLTELPAILETNKAWICKHLADYTPLSTEINLPQELDLKAFNQRWRVIYMPAYGKVKVYERPECELVLMGKVDDKAQCIKVLAAWLRKYASLHLSQALSSISQSINLSYTSLSVKDQKSIWGSCAADKSINLNYKLIFLPPYLMRHVLIHELCHTKHLNHSLSFWKLVAKFDLDWQENRALLRQANAFIPLWLLF